MIEEIKSGKCGREFNWVHSVEVLAVNTNLGRKARARLYEAMAYRATRSQDLARMACVLEHCDGHSKDTNGIAVQLCERLIRGELAALPDLSGDE
eukprot:5534498-Lingulodinium_polyedra.AAC.1